MSRRIPTAFEKWTSRLFAVAMLLGFVLGLFIAWKMMDGTPATTTAGDHTAVLNDTSPSQTGAITYHGVDISGQGSVAVQYTVQPFELVQGVMARAQLVATANVFSQGNGLVANPLQGSGANALITNSADNNGDLQVAFGTTDMAAIETMKHGGETAQVNLTEATSACSIVCLTSPTTSNPLHSVYSLLAPSATPANTALLAAAIFAALITYMVSAAVYGTTRTSSSDSPALDKKWRISKRFGAPTGAAFAAAG